MATPRYQTLQELIQRVSKETSPSSRQSLSEQIRNLATLGAQDVHVLRQNPFAYPPTIAVPLGDIMTDLSTINVILSMGSLGVESLTDLAIEQVRSLWSEIVMWLDFLHPGNLVLCRNVSLSPLVIVGTSSCVAAALSYIFRWKHRFLDLLGQAPQCYRIAIDLWLRFPIYTEQSDFDENTYTTYDLLAETLPTVFAINGEPPSVVDFIAKEEALAVVGHRAGRLHRKAMICLKLCAQSRYAEAASMTSNQISAMRFLVKHVHPMPCFPRDFVRDIVHITRLLQEQNQIDNAVAGCRLLEDVWEKAADDRSIVWAINAGIMPVLIAVNREGYLTPTMKIVVKRTVFLPVARALAKKHPEGLELRNGGMQPDLAVPMHEELADRMNIAKNYSYGICANSKCPGNPTGNVKRCGCFQVAYCSIVCQVVDRPRHSKYCRHRPLFAIHDHPDMPPLHTHFTCTVIDSYFRRVGRSAARKLSERVSDHDTPPIHHIEFDFAHFYPPFHACATTDVYDSQLSEPAVRSRVYAGPYRGYNVWAETNTWPLSKFKRMMEEVLAENDI